MRKRDVFLALVVACYGLVSFVLSVTASGVVQRIAEKAWSIFLYVLCLVTVGFLCQQFSRWGDSKPAPVPVDQKVIPSVMRSVGRFIHWLFRLVSSPKK